MNAVTYAISEMQNKIPYELLWAGMTIDERPEVVRLNNLDSKIDAKIMKRRIRLDCNIVGGIGAGIPLNNIPPSYAEDFYTVYQIPEELTMGRQIVSAMSLTFSPSNGYYGAGGLGNQLTPGINTMASFGQGGCGYNSILSQAEKISGSVAGSAVIGQAHLELIGYNTILVYAHYRQLANFELRVILENSDNMNNIQPRSYKNFLELSTLATKSYIYNKLIMPVNQGVLVAGQDLGVFSSILESYDSAEEDYDIFLREKWGKTAFMNDTTRYNRYLRSMMPLDL